MVNIYNKEYFSMLYSEKNFNKNIDFTWPFLTRKWLLSLVFDKHLGLSFKPNLNYDSDYFNFSFKSNKYGLRGPCDICSDTVVAGTSFAMGMAVDNGNNWYDYLPDDIKFFNIGFPVGHGNHLNRLDRLYCGNYSRIIYLYHPNCWITAKNFFNANKLDKDIFEYAGWKTNYIDTLSLAIKYWPKILFKQYMKRFVYLNTSIVNYRLDTNYSYMNLDHKSDFFIDEIKNINKLFSRFKEVKIIRVPIKEQIAKNIINNDKLNDLINNYEINWQIFLNSINCEFDVIDITDSFCIYDYYPNDTHWNSQGNLKAYNYLTGLFN